MTWINVSEKLPVEMEDVIVYDQEQGVSVGYYYKETRCFIRQLDGLRLISALYWFPIPEISMMEFIKSTTESVPDTSNSRHS